MTVVLDPTPAVETSDNNDRGQMWHVSCTCSPRVALCGLALYGPSVPFDAAATECVVCAELEDIPCPKCGEV